MTRWRYSRWDGSQDEFSLDARRALDALSDLLMEGLDANEALEWMRQQGFELAGLDMRVMGTEELAAELRDQVRELERRHDLRDAMREMAERFDDVLEREEAAQRERHGYESAAMNDFLERRHAGDERLSDAIERFREHEFADEGAGDDFRELLEELDRMRRLEDFLDERGERFQGQQQAGYEQAQEIRERVEQLEQMAQAVADGNFEQVSAEELREMLGDAAGQSWILLRDLESTLREQGMLRGDVPELTPRAIRHIGASALASVYASLRKGLHGDHETPDGRGVATPKPDETRPWRYGDALELDIVKTVLNGVQRRVAESGGGGHGLRDADGRVRLAVDDFEVHELDYATQATTVLLLDMSWSMSWAGRFPAAKRVAMAMDQLVRTQYPRDHFFVVGFSTRAREIPIRELPEVCWDMGDPFTNLQGGLLIAEKLIRQHPSSSPQILVITDGQPTAYYRERELHVEWPMGFGGVSPHAVAETMKTVREVTRQGITINTFMLDDAPELVGFVERLTQVNRGRAFYSSPSQLGSFLMVDYIAGRKLQRS